MDRMLLHAPGRPDKQQMLPRRMPPMLSVKKFRSFDNGRFEAAMIVYSEFWPRNAAIHVVKFTIETY